MFWSPVPLPTSGRACYTGGLTKQKMNQTTNADFSKGKMRLGEARGMPKAGGGPTKEEGRKLRAGLVAVGAETFWCRPNSKWRSSRFLFYSVRCTLKGKTGEGHTQCRRRQRSPTLDGVIIAPAREYKEATEGSKKTHRRPLVIRR